MWPLSSSGAALVAAPLFLLLPLVDQRNDDKIGKCHVSCFKISKSKDPVSDWIDHKIGSDFFLPKNRIWIQQIYSHIFFSLSQC